VIGVLLWPGSAGAQVAPSIERLEVSMLPEFDRRAVLVIYRVSLSPSTPLPASLTLPVPAAVGEPHAVAYGDPGGAELLLAPYTRSVQGKWANITLETQSLQVHLEFYADLVIEGSGRRYVFEWPGGVDVADFAYQVQLPVGATDLVVSPPPDGSSVGGDGLTYYQADLGPLPASSTLAIELTYTKTTADLSADLLQAAAPLSRPEATQGGTPDMARALPWLIAGFGLLLIAIGGLWYFRISRQSAAAGGRPRRRSAAERAGKEPREIDASPVFCHSCGTQAGVSDRFCRHCGTRLRQ
jgi:hypothetical protein